MSSRFLWASPGGAFGVPRGSLDGLVVPYFSIVFYGVGDSLVAPGSF